MPSNSKVVTLKLSSSSLKPFESVFLHQPTPAVESKSTILSPTSQHQQIKKIVIKRPVSSSSKQESETAPPTGSTTPNNSNSKSNNTNASSGRSGMSASANGGLLELDKSGKPTKKWMKEPRAFKSFSGYTTEVMIFKQNV